jgi:toxin-antitoxin system PIN domain toxin
MTFFPDVNVWLALIVAEHAQSGQAQAWAEETSRDWLALNRITQMGVMRLLTNRAVMAGDAMTGAAAWRVVDELLEHENIRFAREPDGLEKAWRDLTPPAVTGPNFWTDAYLAAFARTTGFTLVTFDRGFSKYRDIPVKILASA